METFIELKEYIFRNLDKIQAEKEEEFKRLEVKLKKSSNTANLLTTAGVITVGTFAALFAAPVAATLLGGLAIGGAITGVSTALHVGNILHAINEFEKIEQKKN